MIEPTPANLLAVASYGIGGRLNQLKEILRLLDEMHGPRNMTPDLVDSDMRCKTCYTSSGKPCPWPCETWIRFGEILDMRQGPAAIALFHALGRERNGARIRNAKELVAAMLAEARQEEQAAIEAGE